MTVTMNYRPATDKQVSFIAQLRAERVDDLGAYDLATEVPLNTETASRLIAVLMRCPRRSATPSAKVELESGIYLHAGNVYKVQRAVHGSGNMYAKVLTAPLEEDGKWFFAYSQGTIRQIRPEEKMTLEQAKEFGAIYGVCCNCGATLTNEESIELGIGPVCRKRFSA